jgi:peptidoglycan/xylan/chitin deacetylase (PgdA/CDA1 family)
MTQFRVALSFDAEHPDRPSEPGAAEALLATLERRELAATFFVQGRWAESNPETVRRIVAGGHLVGSHSHYHARMPLLTDDGLAEDLRYAAAAIQAAARVDPRPWFRCPFGTGASDERVLAAVATAGYRHVGWHVSGDDWEPSRNATVVADTVVDGAVRHGDGVVVLLHTWPPSTVPAVEMIVTRLAEAGAEFCRVDQLADIPAGVPE